VVGSAAFEDLERTKAGLVQRLRLRIEVSEIAHQDGRVLLFSAPARAIGAPVSVEGAYWMRAGENLVPMTADMLRRTFDEARPDFSAEICEGASLSDLEPKAIEEFRRRWHGRSQLPTILTLPTERLLCDAELISRRGVTYAAPGRLEVDTRRGRLDRAKNRALLLERVIANAEAGTRFEELQHEVLPELSRDQTRSFVRAERCLRALISIEGKTMPPTRTSALPLRGDGSSTPTSRTRSAG
jgi:hypothetical protein